MCGRFGLTDIGPLIADIHDSGIQVADGRPGVLDSIRPRYNIAPTQPVLALLSVGETAPKAEGAEAAPIFAMPRWGLVPFWAKSPDIGGRLINARSETVASKPAYRTPFSRGRRCLIFADLFYEWQKVEGGRKQPWAFAMKDASVFAFAGLWDKWSGKGRTPEGAKPAEDLLTCTILTTTPNSVTEPVHDRMPVIIPRSSWATWLSPDEPVALLQDLLVPFAPEAMRSWPVSPHVNSPKNDDPQCIVPVPGAGLLEA